MIKIAICDDDINAIDIASELIHLTAKKQKTNIEISKYTNAADVSYRILHKKEQIDILVLDVDMPQITGLQLAEKLRDFGEKVIIIFLSAHEEYVFKAIEYTPFRYVRKIQMNLELPLALQAAFAVIKANSDKEIFVKTDAGEQRICLSEILYYEVFGRKIAIYLRNGAEIVVKKTIKEMGDIINEQYFITLHRNCVVNANYIKKFADNIITLEDEQKLIIGRTRLKEVKEKLLNFWGNLV